MTSLLMPVRSVSARKRSTTSGSSGLDFHCRSFFEKIWHDSSPSSSALPRARSTPPAADMCEPNANTMMHFLGIPNDVPISRLMGAVATHVVEHDTSPAGGLQTQSRHGTCPAQSVVGCSLEISTRSRNLDGL